MKRESVEEKGWAPLLLCLESGRREGSKMERKLKGEGDREEMV